MLDQGAREVIVVDYSCPDGTGDYVRANFAKARVVTVENEQYFSNWKARNAGAALAKADFIVFCDADMVLHAQVVEGLLAALPDRTFGLFSGTAPKRFRDSQSRLAKNQLRGFHVIPTEAFRRVGGYDEVLEGYAAGADTDLQGRLQLAGLAAFDLDPEIVAQVIVHSDSDRLKEHRDSMRLSYGAGQFYRAAKLMVLRITGELEMPLPTRQKLYAKAREQARSLLSQGSESLTVKIVESPVLMPRVLGFDAAIRRISLKIDVVGTKKSAEPPTK